MDPSPQDPLLAAVAELGVNPAILIAALSKHLNSIIPQTTQTNASNPSSSTQSSALFNAQHQLFGREEQASPTGSAGLPLALPSAALPPVEKAGPPIPVPSSQGIRSSVPFTDQHQPLGEAGLGRPASSAESSLALPSVALPPVRATDPLLPTPSSQAVSHSAAPVTSALPPASLSSQLHATAGGALDYFQTGPPIPPALSSASAIHPRLERFQQTLSGHMQAFSQLSPAPQQLLPWEGNQPVATQWGAIGPVPSVVPMPSAVPAALASAFPVTPTKAGGPSERPLPRVTAKLAATVGKPGQRGKAKPAEKPKPRAGVPISYKKLYIIPVHSIEQLSEQVKYACSVSNLAGHPALHNAMSDEEVRQEIRDYFSEERCGIDWKKHSLGWFELSRQSGTLLWPTNLRAFPTGKDLANTYQGKKLLIVRLTTTADIPIFKETLRGATSRFRKASGSYRPRGRRFSDDSDGNTVIKTFTCKSCNGTFALDEKLAHEGKCPVRIQPRKRNISTVSHHSRHHSEPPDVSPVTTRKKKRPRGNPASSDGEVEIFAREPKRLRSRTLKKQDFKGFTDEELDEILDDSDANDEEDDVDVPGMGLYRHRSLELDGQKRDSEDEDSEAEKDELDGDDEDKNGLRDASDTSDDEGLDPTYRGANSGEENEEEWDTSVAVRSRPSHSRSKGRESLGSNLCPFCDEALPDDLGAKYHNTVAALKELATPDPTPANPHHLHLPLMRSITACALHRSKARLLAMQANGHAVTFPESIDFKALSLRIANLYPKLLLAAKWPISSRKLEAFRYGDQPLKTLPDRHNSMSCSHAGYYGEQGREIILKNLLKLFPSSTFRPSSILSPSDFIFFILLPYTAFLLIGEDNPLLEECKLWDLWEQSRQYGLDRYPSTDSLD